jgi:hypothetical protein
LSGLLPSASAPVPVPVPAVDVSRTQFVIRAAQPVANLAAQPSAVAILQPGGAIPARTPHPQACR